MYGYMLGIDLSAEINLWQTSFVLSIEKDAI